jgi:phosphoribosylformylglycinamidine synthase
VWEQYDHPVQGNTAQRPGGDAARWCASRAKGARVLARRHAALLRRRSHRGRQAGSAECWRNLTAVGAEPLALTDNSIRQPREAGDHGRAVGAIEGIGRRCRALDFPVVSGNVSLYKRDRRGGDPADAADLVASALLRDLVVDEPRIAFKRMTKGEDIFLIGAGATVNRGSATSASRSGTARNPDPRKRRVHPPPVDLAHEKAVGDFVSRPSFSTSAWRPPVHDCFSDGGPGRCFGSDGHRGQTSARS